MGKIVPSQGKGLKPSVVNPVTLRVSTLLGFSEDFV